MNANDVARSRRAGTSFRAVTVLALLLAAATVAGAQQDARITPNFKDADITQIVEAVSAATGKNFIVDPRVRAQVTMLSSTPMSPEAFYQAFLAILQVHGFVAVPAGNVIKIIPDANARQLPANDLPDRVSATSDEIVTQVIAVDKVSAAQLVPVLRPLIPQYGHLAAYPASNILIISDRAANVNRIIRIIRRIDQAGDADIEVVPLQNASAAEIVRIVTQLYQAQAAEGGGAALRIVADDRSNSVLLSGDRNQRLRLKALIAHLDTPLENGGDTQVRYLRYADAEKIATRLKEQIGVTIATTGAAPGGAAGGQAASSVATSADKSTAIWADPDTNALVVTAPPKVMRALMSIVDKLDIRRAQVLVEAIIVEVNASKGANLGVSWVVDGSRSDNAVGGFLPQGGNSPVVNLASAALNRSAQNLSTLPSGFLVGVGRLQDTGINFAAVLNALRSDTNSNVIATPSTVTMDNQEAELRVAREVPFLTGQFTNTGATNGSVNPFQTIQREEVGTILKVTPQINEGDSVMLKINLESSELEGAVVAGVANLNQITSKRTVSTNVLIEDGGTVVLGGLLRDRISGNEDRVPFLGRIPLIGEAFRHRSATKEKTNLMVFIKPRILRDANQTTIETNQKYNYMRNEQLKSGHREVIPLLPLEKKPVLPALPPEPPPGAPEAGAPQAGEPRP
ncbi:MAG: type II secretion system secretin GspD [Gammaproteobacteria bacterium]|nr:type II secretion system secretin GspD [Gammaproteobacteria bacterium]